MALKDALSDIKTGSALSDSTKKMSQATRVFSKDADEAAGKVEELRKKEAELGKQLAKAQTVVDKHSTALEAARVAYADLGDETSRLNLERAHADYNKAADGANKLTRKLHETRREVKALDDASSMAAKNPNGLQQLLSDKRFTKMLSGLAIEGSAILGTSAFGTEGGTLLSSTVEGAISGAAIGAAIPVIGPAAGALIGGGIGAIKGGLKVYEKKDEAFKGYVQEQTEGVLAQRSSDIQTGSIIAANREQEEFALNNIFGSEQLTNRYLEQVKAMEAGTNFSYDDILGYSQHLVQPFGMEKSLDIVAALSDTSAALDLNDSDVEALAKGFSDIQATGRVTQEQLNAFAERGVDVYAALSKWGDATTVNSKVAGGEIESGEAVEAILNYLQTEFNGMSAAWAKTHLGQVNKLENIQDNMNEAYGIGYNQEKDKGLEEQQEWLSGDSGKKLMEAYEAMGAWQADLENKKDEYIRNALDAAMESEEYQAAQAEGDAAEMGRIIATAQVKGNSDYLANEGKDQELASQIALAEAIRTDPATMAAYEQAGYAMGIQFSKGMEVAVLENTDTLFYEVDPMLGYTINEDGSITSMWDPPTITTSDEGEWNADHSVWIREIKNPDGRPTAIGLDRVPYDGYAALLHEGERVLTAREVREADRGGGGGKSFVIHVTGNTFQTGQGGGVGDIAHQLADQILLELDKGVL